MNREEQIDNLRRTLTASPILHSACVLIWEQFSKWPQRRPDVADILARLTGEENYELRKATAALIDRLIHCGALQQLADGALVQPALPLEEVLGMKKRPRRHADAPAPLVIEVLTPPVPDPEADLEDETADDEVGLELGEAVLAGLYSIYLERKGGVFNADAVGRDLRNLFQEWKLPRGLWESRKAIQRVINDCFDRELLEGVEEGYWRLTERGLAEAQSAYNAWHRRLEHAPNSG